MLHSMIKAIRTVDSLADITILLADNYRPDILDYQPHRTIHYPKNTADLAELSRNYDCIIFSGGAIIDDSAYSSEKMSLDRLVIELGSLFISNGKRCALYSVSTAHTSTNQNYITKLAYIIDNSYHVSVRDTFSLATLKAAKIDTSSVNVVDDIVFADNIFNTIDSSQKRSNIDHSSFGAIFVFTDKNKADIANFIKKILSFLPKEASFTVFPFYDYRDHDAQFISYLENKFSDSRLIFRKDTPKNIEELARLLESFDVIISMRYHGTLIATALGKTVLSVDLHGHSHYTNKNRYIYEHYGIKGLSVKNSGLHKFNKAQYERLLASSGKTPDIKTLYIDASTQLHTMLTKLLNEGVE